MYKRRHEHCPVCGGPTGIGWACTGARAECARRIDPCLQSAKLYKDEDETTSHFEDRLWKNWDKTVDQYLMDRAGAGSAPPALPAPPGSESRP